MGLRRPAFAALFALLVGAGCKSEQLVCGDHTRAENGRCVADLANLCAVGTHASGGACVPDDTTTCGEGTVLRDGACRPVAPSCGSGTEERDGVCELADPLARVTVWESAEPNVPPGAPAVFTLPAVDAPPVVLGGRVGVAEAGTPDFDGFVFTASAFDRLRLRATAVGAPSVGVSVQPVDQTLKFYRFALSLTERGAGRDVVLPVGGDWIVVVSDQSNLTQGIPMGSPDFTYTVDVSRVRAATRKPLAIGGSATGRVGDIDVYSVQSDPAKPLVDFVLLPPFDPPFPGLRALWLVDPDGKLQLNVTDDSTWGDIEWMAPARLALRPGTSALAVDYQYTVSSVPGPVLFPYTLFAIAVPITSVGAPDVPAVQSGSLKDDGNEVYAVDVRGGSVLTAVVTLPTGTQIIPRIELRNEQYELVAGVNGPRLGRYFPHDAAGRYYVVLSDRWFDESKTALDYSLAVANPVATPVGPVAVGSTESSTAAVPQGGSAWFAVYAGNDAALALTLRPAAGVDARFNAWGADMKRTIAVSNAGGVDTVESAAGLLAPAGGVVLVEVDATPAGQVTLEASASATPTVFEQEPNNDTAHANSVALDGAGHADVAAFMETTEDKDVFAVVVTGTTPATLVARTRAGILGGRMDTRLDVLSESGTLAADDNGDGLFSKVTATVQPGTVYIQVSRWPEFGSFDGIDYQLSIDVKR